MRKFVLIILALHLLIWKVIPSSPITPFRRIKAPQETLQDFSDNTMLGKLFRILLGEIMENPDVLSNILSKKHKKEQSLLSIPLLTVTWSLVTFLNNYRIIFKPSNGEEEIQKIAEQDLIPLLKATKDLEELDFILEQTTKIMFNLMVTKKVGYPFLFTARKSQSLKAPPIAIAVLDRLSNLAQEVLYMEEKDIKKERKEVISLFTEIAENIKNPGLAKDPILGLIAVEGIKFIAEYTENRTYSLMSEGKIKNPFNLYKEACREVLISFLDSLDPEIDISPQIVELIFEVALPGVASSAENTEELKNGLNTVFKLFTTTIEKLGEQGIEDEEKGIILSKLAILVGKKTDYSLANNVRNLEEYLNIINEALKEIQNGKDPTKIIWENLYHLTL